MAEDQRTPGTDEEVPMPKWVYAVGAAVVLLVVLFVVMHFASGGLPTHLAPK